MSTIGFEDLSRKRAIVADTLLTDTATWLEEEYKDETLEKRKAQLRAICRNLPAMLHDSGLLTTLLYLSRSKESKSANVSLNGHSQDQKDKIKLRMAKGILDWLQFYRSLWEEDGEIDFISYLVNDCDVKEQLVLTREAVSFAGWMKKSAENFL